MSSWNVFWRRLRRRMGAAAPPGDRALALSGRATRSAALAQAAGVLPVDPAESEHYLRAWLSLTTRQKQVVVLVCQGMTNVQIARRLRISRNTVKCHLHAALLRFELHTRSELRVALARWDFTHWRG